MNKTFDFFQRHCVMLAVQLLAVSNHIKSNDKVCLNFHQKINIQNIPTNEPLCDSCKNNTTKNILTKKTIKQKKHTFYISV